MIKGVVPFVILFLLCTPESPVGAGMVSSEGSCTKVNTGTSYLFICHFLASSFSGLYGALQSALQGVKK
jgi:hypothetical protein